MNILKKIVGFLWAVAGFILDVLASDKEPQGEERNYDVRYDHEPDNVHNFYNPKNPHGIYNPYYHDD